LFPWSASQEVPLPAGFSLRSIPFRLPASGRTSRETIVVLGDLHLDGRWPVAPLRRDALRAEREAYQAAADIVTRTCQAGDPRQTLGDALDALREAIDGLRKKVDSTLPARSSDHKDALNFIDELDATMAVFGTPNYAVAMIGDTEQHEARTVEELLAF